MHMILNQKAKGGSVMNEFKITGMAMVITASTFIGFIAGDKFKKRVYQLNEIERAITLLQNEIIYTQSILPEVMDKVAEKIEAPVNLVFLNIAEELYSHSVNSVYDAFKNAIMKCENSLTLKDEDKRTLLDLGKTLGYGSIEGHKNIFNLTLDNLKRLEKDAVVEMNKNLRLYRYLGFSFGALVLIFIT